MFSPEMKLAIDGGRRAVTDPLPPVYPAQTTVAEEEERELVAALRDRQYWRYDARPSRVEAFEALFRQRMGTVHCLAVSSGTAALSCALAGLAIGPGDEVVVPAFTWFSTATSVIQAGAVPVLAEIDESLTLDVADVSRKLSPQTRAVLAVHMNGAACDLDGLTNLAKTHQLKLIEDTAQALGGTHGGKPLGTLGDVGTYSLQFHKIITSGEGGVLVARDRHVFERAASYHDIWAPLKLGVDPRRFASRSLAGLNHRMSELTGALALVQLRRLDDTLAALGMRKAALVSDLEPLCREFGVAIRSGHDGSGDTGTSVVFLLPQARRTRSVVEALEAEGVTAYALYDTDVFDPHVYCNWTPLLEKRPSQGQASPWDHHPREVSYAPDMCPRTLDILSRAIEIEVSPAWTEINVEQIALGIRKVLAALLDSPVRSGRSPCDVP